MTRDTKIIGLTGPTGAGKSTVAGLFEDEGCFVIDADKVAREVVSRGECLDKLKKEFGSNICDDSGRLNRQKLAKIVFADKRKVGKLNQLTHTYIVEKIKNLIKNNFNKYKIIVLDAPLLKESGLDAICDEVICVMAPREVRLERIIKRDSLTEFNAFLRLNAQKNDKYYTTDSSYIMYGTKKKSELRAQVIKFIDELEK